MAVDRLSLLLEVERANERRREMVIWCLFNVYLQLNDYIECLKWLNRLLIDKPENQQVRALLWALSHSSVLFGQAWFAVCCVLLEIGDVGQTKEAAEKLSDADLANIVQGLCSFSESDYSGNFHSGLAFLGAQSGCG